MHTQSKRIGYFFLCLVPLIIVVFLQLLLSIPAMAIAGIQALRQGSAQGDSLSEILSHLREIMSSSSFTVALSAAYAVFALILFGIWYWKRFAPEEEKLPMRHPCNPAILGSLALLAIGGQYVTTYLVTAVAALFPAQMQRYESLLQSIDVGHPTLLLAIYSCIIAPISEEFIFRGVVFGYAKKALPIAGAICYQSILFGVFHMNFIQGVYVAFFGLFLGYVRAYGGTIIYPMILHFFFNLIGTFFNSFLFFHMDHPFFFLLYLTVGVLAAYAGVFLFQYGVKQRNQNTI